jgi:tRNA pseudouridine55 synthase
MDGLLLVDKPAGPTSHDVVERMRIVLGERRIGHTGTLDPAATGLLPLVLGRATRLARFLTAGAKSYEAAIRLGVDTSSGDADGDPVGVPFAGTWPSREAVDRALDTFRGTFAQQPPAFSAKRIGGRRSYELARRSRGKPGGGQAAVQPASVTVTAYRIDLIAYDGDTVTVTLDCSAGFYVRSLAADLGRQLGTGAHLTRLRRTRSGSFTVDRALPLADAERRPDLAAASIVPMAGMLPEWASVTLNAEGVRRAIAGRDIGPADVQASSESTRLWGPTTHDQRSATNDPTHDQRLKTNDHVCLVDGAGELVGVGEPSHTPGLLHPSVVLK